MAIVYVDFFNGGESVDLEILAKVSGKSIYSDRPDGPKIKVFAIGSMNSYPDENRFPVFVDDAFDFAKEAAAILGGQGFSRDHYNRDVRPLLAGAQCRHPFRW